MHYPKPNFGVSRKRKIAGFILAVGLLSIGIAFASFLGFGLFAIAPSQQRLSAEEGEAFCAKQYALDPKLPPKEFQARQTAYQACLAAYYKQQTPKLNNAINEIVQLTHTVVVTRPEEHQTPAGAGKILDLSGGAELGPFYNIENSWLAESQGKVYQVFAGARREEGPPQLRSEMQGMITVWVRGSDFNPLPGSCGHELPINNGPLRIADAMGLRLILRLDDGTTFYFDVPTCRFISNLNAPSFEITPQKPACP